ncbi:MAG: TfoX/Sxy family protein [Nevskiales bacterium]
MSGNWLHEVFEAVVPSGPGITRRRMFGFHCAFLSGNLFCGHSQQTFMLRLSETDRVGLLALPGSALFEPKAGFVMREYVVPAPELLEDLDRLRSWVNKSLSYAASLAPKPRKTRQTTRRPRRVA